MQDQTPTTLEKTPTGVPGLDEITEGGLPAGRPTLVCGGPGCGKTLLATQFLVEGTERFREPGIFLTFEETADELAANVASLGWDLVDLQARGLLGIDQIRISRTEIQETGDYDLEGLFIRIGALVERLGAKRIAIDTLEVLFATFTDHQILRAELQRLFGWLKARGLTAVITAERGDGELTRHGLEEYVSDCVILLDHRVENQISTRRLRVVKYRGTHHDANETPFMIDEHGFRVMPTSSLRLEHAAPEERVSSGIDRLDTMLDGDGYYRGASVLITGPPGSGKSTIAASFLAAGCARGERGILFAFEESPAQLLRNMRSVGIDLAPHVDSGLLRIRSVRPSAHGVEAHLASMVLEVMDFAPELVVVDPLSAMNDLSDDASSMLIRLVDHLKSRGVTALGTSLTRARSQDITELGISSVIDIWIDLDVLLQNGERNRALSIIKARGTAHSNQMREFLLTSAGVSLADVYVGAGDVLMGTARQVQQATDEARMTESRRTIEAQRIRIERRRAAVAAQIKALTEDLEAEIAAAGIEIGAAEAAEDQLEADSRALAEARGADGKERL